jgi:hypothetical protein
MLVKEIVDAIELERGIPKNSIPLKTIQTRVWQKNVDAKSPIINIASARCRENNC